MTELFRKEINVMTGEEKIIYLTEEEIKQMEAAEAERIANLPPPPPEPTPAEKLKAAGLTVDELKTLLGL